MKFLIAEDEKVSRMILLRTLEKQGYEVLVAKNGQEGWEIFQKEKEDIYVAILDWVMPEMDGLELCHQIKKSQVSHYVYVMFLTAKTEIKDIVEGLDTGADDYLTKPVDNRELLSRIKVGLKIIELEKALKEANRQLHILATTDGLTGILNRRAILERLLDELSRADREKKPLCLIMFDIDRFKNVNDTYGHDAGDKVLIEVVDRIKSELRPYDIMGRYGGEEFLLGIPETDLNTGKIIAERFRTCICERPFEINDKKLKVSISLGISNTIPPRNCDTNKLIETMIKSADDALYKAKETGRNKVVCG